LNTIKKLLHRFKFDKPLDYEIKGYGHNLSGGQKQKLGVSLTSIKNISYERLICVQRGFYLA
ncbi:hypothetical protein ACSLO2_27350, partial [Escherichia coli]|uniref:hypothetical protein n=1 Tax=Escherichia coli TaxID=562 RepID=UPI003EE40222